MVDPRGGLPNVLVRVVEGGGGPYAPPAEPVVSANSGADHFQRAGQAAAPAKGAS